MNYPKRVKLTVKTPKNQAEKAMKNQRTAMLGFKQADKILEEKLVNDHEFYWIIQVKDFNDEIDLQKKVIRSEVIIKKFYSTLMKLINRANKLANKFEKGVKWIRAWLMKRLQKENQTDMIEKLKAMTDDEIKDFLVISDEKEMKAFLAGDLMILEDQSETTN